LPVSPAGFASCAIFLGGIEHLFFLNFFWGRGRLGGLGL
jgi:hypothetical protein